MSDTDTLTPEVEALCDSLDEALATMAALEAEREEERTLLTAVMRDLHRQGWSITRIRDTVATPGTVRRWLNKYPATPELDALMDAEPATGEQLLDLWENLGEIDADIDAARGRRNAAVVSLHVDCGWSMRTVAARARWGSSARVAQLVGDWKRPPRDASVRYTPLPRPVELRSKEWLRNEYINQERAVGEIAASLGTSGPIVIAALKEARIKLRPRSRQAVPVNTAAVLRRHARGVTLRAMGTTLGFADHDSLYEALMRDGHRGRRRRVYPALRDKEWLVTQLSEQGGSAGVASVLGCTPGTVERAMIRHGLMGPGEVEQ